MYWNSYSTEIRLVLGPRKRTLHPVPHRNLNISDQVVVILQQFLIDQVLQQDGLAAV